MTIDRLTASFGKLDGETLELKEGMNVIVAPNESGKTTWCAFIRAMLYGIDSSERVKSGNLPDKTRYMPWSGAAMQGEMELKSGGKSITVSRTTRLRSAPMREFSAVYSGTSIAVDGLNSTNAGEKLTGVSKDVFMRSAFVGQGAVAVSGSPELEKRINSIVSTGDEGSSYTEAAERLKAWQRIRYYNRRGKMPELSEKIAETRRKLGDIDYISHESERISEELKQKQAECAELSEAVTEGRKTARKEILNKLSRLRAERNAAEEELQCAESRENACKDELNDSPIGELSPESAEEKITADKENSIKLKQTAERKNSSAPAIIVFLLAAALLVASILLVPEILIPSIIVSVVLIALASVLLVKTGKKRQESAQAAGEREKLLRDCKIADESGFDLVLREYRALYEAHTEAVSEKEKAREKLAEVNRDRDIAEKRSLDELDFSDGSSETARLGRELAAKQKECEVLMARLSELDGRMSVIGDPLVLRSELISMEEEYKELNDELESIELALKVLSAADDDIQSRFSPELGRLASEYMSYVTDGRYGEVLLNRDFTAVTKTEDDSVHRETGYLSAGTLDLMYLCVRLAVCTLALPEGTSCPLILDDTLTNLDEKRTEAALRLLNKIAETRQVILFTCKNI